MAPILASLVGILADKGLNLISSAIDGGADKAKEFIEEKTGIKSDSDKELTKEELVLLQKLETDERLALEALALENKKEANRHGEKY